MRRHFRTETDELIPTMESVRISSPEGFQVKRHPWPSTSLLQFTLINFYSLRRL